MTTKIEGGPSAKPVEARTVTETAPRAGGAREAGVVSTPPVDSLRLTGEALGLKAMARELSTPSKLDTAKIRDVRSAIESGSYEIHPQEIATRMLALERELLQ